MKTLLILIAIFILTCVTAFAAGTLPYTHSATPVAAGTLPYTHSATPVAVQNLVGLSPVAATANCTTASGTNGTIATVTTTGYIGLKWAAIDSTGAPVIVKRCVNSNTAYIPGSSDTMTLNNGISSVKFQMFSSSVNKTITVCQELQ